MPIDQCTVSNGECEYTIRFNSSMEEMKAFHAAMVPLMTEAAAMIVLVRLLVTAGKAV